MFGLNTGNFFSSSANSWAELTVEPKISLFGNYSLYFLVASLFLIILAKNANTRSFTIVFQLFFRARKTDVRIKENWPVMASASWFLALNFILTLSHSLYLLLEKNIQTEQSVLILSSLGISFSFFFLAFLSMFVIGVLTGLKKVYQIPMQLTWVLPQFVGLVFFIVNIIWVLNPSFSIYLIYIFLSFFLLLSIQRIIRSAFFLIASGVEWYYILLYLCTLEIMPLSVLAWFLFDWIV